MYVWALPKNKQKKFDKIKNLYSPQNLACYLLLGGWKEDTCTRGGGGNIFPNPCQKKSISRIHFTSPTDLCLVSKRWGKKILMICETNSISPHPCQLLPTSPEGPKNLFHIFISQVQASHILFFKSCKKMSGNIAPSNMSLKTTEHFVNKT